MEEKKEKIFNLGIGPYLSFEPKITIYKVNPDVTQQQLDEDSEKIANEYLTFIDECATFKVKQIILEKMKRKGTY